MQFHQINVSYVQILDDYVAENNLSIKMKNSLITMYMRLVGLVDGNTGKTIHKYRQKVIGKAIGFCREWTCVLIRHLEKCGLVKKIKMLLPSEIDNMYANYFIYELPEQVKLIEERERNKEIQESGNKIKKVIDRVKNGNDKNKNYGKKESVFNDFSQRQYDYAKLEQGLLGESEFEFNDVLKE